MGTDPRCLITGKGKGFSVRGIWLCLWYWLALAPVGWAEPVTLTAPGGGLSLSGELLAFDGRFYRIETGFGTMTVAGEKVVCTGAACPGDGETTGFTLVAPPDLSRAVLPALVHLFAAVQGLNSQQEQQDGDGLAWTLRRPGQTRSFPIRVIHGHAGAAYDALAAGKADMVLTTRLARPGERAGLRQAGLGDPTDPRQAQILAYDALVLAEPFPGRGAPLSLADLQQRLRSQGGRPVHARAGAGDFDRLLGQADAMPQADVVWADSAHGLARTLQGAGQGLGLTLLSQINGLRPRPLMGQCGLTLRPVPTAILTGGYPLRLPVLAVLPARRLPRDMVPFIAFLQSDRAGAVLRRSGYLRASAKPVDMPDLGARFLAGLAQADADAAPEYAALARVLHRARRLDVAVPSDTGPEAALMIAKARDLLVDAIAAGAFDGKELILIGFDDRGTDPAMAAAKRLQAALAVRFTDGLPAAIRVRVMGAGAALPLTCPDGPWAREVNRRVEIWLRD